MNPVKYLSKDIINQPTPFDVWFQGTLQDVEAGKYVIIADSTGKVKITGWDFSDVVIDYNGCQTDKFLCTPKGYRYTIYLSSLSFDRPGDGDKILGNHYCVIGVAVETNNMPEIKAAKFININSHHQNSWESEVKEAQLFLQGKIIPKIK